MQYAVELYYDEKTEQRLHQLAQGIADRNISTKFLEWRTRPHLTLACFNDVEEPACIERLNAFAAQHSVMPASLASVGMFPDTKTVFISPVMTGGMFQFQRELHAALAGFDTSGWEWYCPDRWTPHCTIALTREDDAEAFFRASRYLLEKFQKLSGTFASIGLVKVTFPVQELATIALALPS